MQAVLVVPRVWFVVTIQANLTDNNTVIEQQLNQRLICIQYQSLIETLKVF